MITENTNISTDSNLPYLWQCDDPDEDDPWFYESKEELKSQRRKKLQKNYTDYVQSFEEDSALQCNNLFKKSISHVEPL